MPRHAALDPTLPNLPNHTSPSLTGQIYAADSLSMTEKIFASSLR